MNLSIDDPAVLRALLEGFYVQREKLNSNIAEIEHRLGIQQSAAVPFQSATPIPNLTPSSNYIPDIPVPQRKATRNISPESRQRIVEAQKRRWAEQKARQAKLEKLEKAAKR